jgi:hypothetical protein
MKRRRYYEFSILENIVDCISIGFHLSRVLATTSSFPPLPAPWVFSTVVTTIHGPVAQLNEWGF